MVPLVSVLGLHENDYVHSGNTVSKQMVCFRGRGSDRQYHDRESRFTNWKRLNFCVVRAVRGISKVIQLEKTPREVQEELSTGWS